MSFGFSPSDIVALVAITSKAYRGWKNACGEYSEVTGSLDSFLIVLERIEKEASKPSSVLIRNTRDKEDLEDILRNSESTIRELHAIVARFKSLGSSREKNWDKLRLGIKNIEPLRVKLTQHIAAITAYLDTVGLGALGRIERDLNAIPERIQRTIDGLAAEIRAGRREGTIMTTYSDDETDVWKQFRRELIGDGMKSSTVHKYKPLIRKYLKDLAERGELEELPPETETLTRRSVLDPIPLRGEASEESRPSAFDVKASPTAQVQQFEEHIDGTSVSLATGASEPKSTPRKKMGLKDTKKPAAVPDTKLPPFILALLDSSFQEPTPSPPEVQAEREAPTHEHTTSVDRNRSLQATVEDADESDAVVDIDITERREPDRRESQVPNVEQSTKLSSTDVTDANQQNEPDVQVPIDEQAVDSPNDEERSILEAVEKIAADERTSPQRTPTIVSEHRKGDTAFWKHILAKLKLLGFKPSDVETHKSSIYFRLQETLRLHVTPSHAAESTPDPAIAPTPLRPLVPRVEDYDSDESYVKPGKRKEAKRKYSSAPRRRALNPYKMLDSRIVQEWEGSDELSGDERGSFGSVSTDTLDQSQPKKSDVELAAWAAFHEANEAERSKSRKKGPQAHKGPVVSETGAVYKFGEARYRPRSPASMPPPIPTYSFQPYPPSWQGANVQGLPDGHHPYAPFPPGPTTKGNPPYGPQASVESWQRPVYPTADEEFRHSHEYPYNDQSYQQFIDAYENDPRDPPARPRRSFRETAI